ncbi:DUF6604 domain-containing protein [Microdochium nivale]|nr:DUF6604 domain-containing protein [Microdochium nivale]
MLQGTNIRNTDDRSRFFRYKECTEKVLSWLAEKAVAQGFLRANTCTPTTLDYVLMAEQCAAKSISMPKVKRRELKDAIRLRQGTTEWYRRFSSHPDKDRQDSTHIYFTNRLQEILDIFEAVTKTRNLSGVAISGVSTHNRNPYEVLSAQHDEGGGETEQLAEAPHVDSLVPERVSPDNQDSKNHSTYFLEADDNLMIDLHSLFTDFAQLCDHLHGIWEEYADKKTDVFTANMVTCFVMRVAIKLEWQFLERNRPHFRRGTLSEMISKVCSCVVLGKSNIMITDSLSLGLAHMQRTALEVRDNTPDDIRAQVMWDESVLLEAPMTIGIKPSKAEIHAYLKADGLGWLGPELIDLFSDLGKPIPSDIEPFQLDLLTYRLQKSPFTKPSLSTAFALRVARRLRAVPNLASRLKEDHRLLKDSSQLEWSDLPATSNAMLAAQVICIRQYTHYHVGLLQLQVGLNDRQDNALMCILHWYHAARSSGSEHEWPALDRLLVFQRELIFTGTTPNTTVECYAQLFLAFGISKEQQKKVASNVDMVRLAQETSSASHRLANGKIDTKEYIALRNTNGMRRELTSPGIFKAVLEPYWEEDIEVMLKRFEPSLNLKDHHAALVQLEVSMRKEGPSLLFPYALLGKIVQPLLLSATLRNVSRLLKFSAVPFPACWDSGWDLVQRWEYFCRKLSMAPTLGHETCVG